MTPKEIVHELDKHIVGQASAKRAVAVALRNRWRRQQVEEPLRQEITPKNILMIGPTGVGKTEIARRLARLANAPFIKIEATKFTEVGYVGRDVDTIIRDLMETAIKQIREQATSKVQFRAEEAAEERILDALLPPPRSAGFSESEPQREDGTARQRFRKMLREGQLDDKEIEIDVAAINPSMEIFAPPGMEDLSQQLQGMFANLGQSRRQNRKLKVREAMKLLTEEEAGRLINDEDTKQQALEAVEQNGIVFLDEIDKIATRSEAHGTDVSRQGVQRDLLPLIEGTTVSTKYGMVKTDHILFIASGAFHLSKPSDLIPEYGMVKTDHILFIASGAFHLSKPSDLIPELQGRLPIRVELQALSVGDFERILTATDACLTRQYEALLATEGVTLKFTDDGIRRIAEIAFEVNERTENIGARRLHTVMEKLLEDISFDASTTTGEYLVDGEAVTTRLAALAASEDLARYVL